jgi:ABC-type molybdate transport system permease subunit
VVSRCSSPSGIADSSGRGWSTPSAALRRSTPPEPCRRQRSSPCPLVISLEGALGGLRPRYEETAASRGASPVRAFFTVTLPTAAPGVVAGAALTWARELGEFGAPITFAGDPPGTAQTPPFQVYLLLQDDPEAATPVSLLLLALAMTVLIALP